MASQYNDPYANNKGGQGHYQSNSYDYNDPMRGATHLPHQSYGNMGPSFDPYQETNLNAPGHSQGHHRSNSSGGGDLQRGGSKKVTYDTDVLEVDRDDSAETRRSGTLRRDASRRSDVPPLSVAPVRKQYNGFDAGEFTPVTHRGRKSLSGLKGYRYDTKGNLWTKGSRARCVGRFACCTIMIAVLLIVSIVLSLALWIRPPSIEIGNVVTRNTTGSLSSPDGLEINLSVDIGVNNPNYFSVDFKQLKVEIFYPPNDVPVGGGEANDIVFASGEHTNFTFPFQLSYRSADDPGSAVFIDLGEKCGIGGTTRKQDISVDYKLSLAIRILLITIKPVVRNTFTFTCPSEIVNGANQVIQGKTS